MGRTPRVLVIDDDRLLCELVRTTFELEGFEVDSAYDVIEAERVLVGSRPDAILLDIGLPGIDGIFYLERLRETPQTSKIPIVAISGSEEAGRAAFDRFDGERLVGDRRDHDDSRMRALAQHRFDTGEPVHFRHRHVHRYDVRLEIFDRL